MTKRTFPVDERRQGGAVRSVRLVLGALVGLAVASCGEDPGPGFVLVSFESPFAEVGAAVVELQGPGLGAVEGLDGSVAVAVSGQNGGTRVVTSSISPISPRFRIAVQDLGADLPVASLVQAVDLENRALLGTAQIQIRVNRQR